MLYITNPNLQPNSSSLLPGFSGCRLPGTDLDLLCISWREKGRLHLKKKSLLYYKGGNQGPEMSYDMDIAMQPISSEPEIPKQLHSRQYLLDAYCVHHQGLW